MATSSAFATAGSAGLDLLEQVAVRVPCGACGQHYTVSLRDVLLSQKMIHDGCPVCNETECLPFAYAVLADESALRRFDESWSQLLRQVRAAGFDLEVRRPVLSH